MIKNILYELPEDPDMDIAMQTIPYVDLVYSFALAGVVRSREFDRLKTSYNPNIKLAAHAVEYQYKEAESLKSANLSEISYHKGDK